ncbi:MAG: twin-arginine translocase TatA/TatE family subunit [Opitutaceae bacterium]
MTPVFAIISALPPLAFIDGVGGPEMLLILVIVLLLFGGDKLPEFARGMGKTVRELKKAASGVEEEFRRAMDEDERKKAAAALEAANPSPPPAETGVEPVAATPSDVSNTGAGPDAQVANAGTPASAAGTPAPAPAKRVIASEDCP